MATTPILSVAKYSSIQPAIDSGVLTYPSYVVCRDDWTWVFVDKDLSIKRLKGYQQEAIIPVDVLPTENYRTDAFYFCNNIGYLFINGNPVPVFKELSEDITSYDQLEDLPLVNKKGTISSPIILIDLADGCYSITGQYKVGGNLTTIYTQPSNAIFVIESDESNKYVTKLDGKKVVTYTISSETMDVVKDEYATQNWVQAQGYTTETYVNQAIEDLYNRIAEETLVSITKVSQLENDAGYLTAENFEEINDEQIGGLF